MTANQREARQTAARSRKCPCCKRLAALSARYELRDDADRRIGSARTCNYCGHEVGVRNGYLFGGRTSDEDSR